MKTARDFLSSKTTWLGIAYVVKAIVTAIYPTRPEFNNVIDQIFAALAVVFVRDTIAKNGEKVVAKIHKVEGS